MSNAIQFLWQHQEPPLRQMRRANFVGAPTRRFRRIADIRPSVWSQLSSWLRSLAFSAL